jgi:hypothetical protein
MSKLISRVAGGQFSSHVRCAQVPAGKVCDREGRRSLIQKLISRIKITAAAAGV